MEGANRAQPVKSADRTLAVIEYLARNGPTGFTSILEQLQLPRSSAHALLHTLRASGWIQQDAGSSRYSLGLRAWQVGQQYTGHRTLADIASPIMDRLAGELGETIQLARLDGTDNVYIGISLSPSPMRLASAVGMRLPAHATGIGKALLSMLEPAEAAERISTAPLQALTPVTITDAALLLTTVAATRRAGYAVDDGEYIDGCRCVAIPLTGPGDGEVISAISVTMPAFRTGPSWPLDLLSPLRSSVAEIRRALGLRTDSATPIARHPARADGLYSSS